MSRLRARSRFLPDRRLQPCLARAATRAGRILLQNPPAFSANRQNPLPSGARTIPPFDAGAINQQMQAFPAALTGSGQQSGQGQVLK